VKKKQLKLAGRTKMRKQYGEQGTSQACQLLSQKLQEIKDSNFISVEDR